MTYTIEKNVPMPAVGVAGSIRGTVRMLEVGDRFVVDAKYDSINGAIQSVRAENKALKFAVRRLQKGQSAVSVWRFA